MTTKNYITQHKGKGVWAHVHTDTNFAIAEQRARFTAKTEHVHTRVIVQETGEAVINFNREGKTSKDLLI